MNLSANRPVSRFCDRVRPHFLTIGFARLCLWLLLAGWGSMAEAQLVISSITPAAVTNAPGTATTFSLNYTWPSLTQAATGAVINVSVPAPANTAASGVSESGDTHTTNVSYTAASQTIAFKFTSPLPAGSSGTVTFSVQLLNTGTVTNGSTATFIATSTVTGQPPYTNSCSLTANSVTDDATLTKSIQGSAATTNSLITYQLLPANATPSLNITNWSMVDTLPPYVTYVGSSPAGVYNASAGTVSWTSNSTPFNVGYKPTFTVQVIAPSAHYSVTSVLTNWVSTTNTFLDGNTVVVTTSNKLTLVTPGVNFGSFSKTASGWNGQFNSPFTWSFAATAKGSDVASTFTITDTNPAAFVPTAIVPGFGGDNPTVVYIQYQTKNNPTWTSLPGSPFTTTNAVNATNQTYYLTNLNLVGDMVTMEQWTYTNTTPLFSFPTAGKPTLTGYITNIDINGNAVSATAIITNYAGLGASRNGTNMNLGTVSNVVPLSVAAPLITLTKSVSAGNPSQPGQTNTWSLVINNGATASSSLTNPVLADLLPASLYYVPGSSTSSGGPTLTNTVATTNYNGTGRTLVKLFYSGYLGVNSNTTAKINTYLASGVVPGSVSNAFSLIGWLNPTINSSSPWVADTNNMSGTGNTNATFPTVSGGLTVSAAAAANSVKMVKGQLDSAYVGYPLYGACYPGGPFNWQETVSNPGNVGLTNITVIDILPYAGDTGVLVTNQARGSAWQPVLTGPVSGPSGVTVYYSQSTNPYRPEILPGGPPGSVNDWSTTLPSDVTTVRALKFAFGPTNVLSPLSSAQLTWSMQVPAAAAPNSLAYNSFAYTATPAISNTAPLISEPNKVGVMAKPLQPAFLGDYVWNDANANGIQDVGEIGINNVRVELYQAGPSGIPGGSDEVFLQFVLTANGPTGKAGYYQFSYLPAGNYFVKVIPPANYAVSPEYQGSDTNLDSSFDPASGYSAEIPLVTGETNESVDCGLYYTAVGTVGDYVWIDRNGDGLQDEGGIDGLNGVAVQIYSETSTTTNLYASTTTAFDSFGNPGYYHFYNLPPGQYQLRFLPAAGDTFTTFEAAGSANSGNESEAHANGWTSSFTVNAGDNQISWDAGIILPSGLLSVGNMVWYDPNADSLYNFNGGERGINNVIVSLYYDTDGNGVFTPGTDQLYSSTLTATLAGQPGNYSFNNLPAGNFIVVLESVNFQPGGALYGLTNDPNWLPATNYMANASKGTWVNGYVATTAFPLAVGTEPTTPDSNMTEDFGLTSPTNLFSVGNTVFLDSNANGTKDDGEPGIANLTIQLWRAGASGVVGGSDAVLLRSTNTDSNGNYLFSYLPPTNYFLEIPTPPASAEAVSPVLYTGTQSGHNRGVQPGGYNTSAFSSNVNLTNNDLTQDFGFFASTGLVAVGNVIFRDDNGNGKQDAGEPGVPGVGLALASIVTGVSSNVVAYTTTGTNGMYLFDLQPPGTYSVVVLATNFQAGGPLANYLSSPGAVAADQYTSLAADQEDHGLDNSSPVVNGIHTIASFFGVGAAPTGATPTSPAQVPAANANLTIDLGFTRPVTIGDYVWNDANANGIQDAGETGLAGVGLTLSGINEGGITVTDHTATDSNGHYQFSEPPGTYTVAADATNFNGGAPLAGYTATSSNGGTRGSDSVGSPGATIPATLAPGASDQTVDFGYYQPVTIGDYVWNDINGDGIQNDGGAAAGFVNVGLTLTGTTAAGVVITNYTTTGAGGQYLFTEQPGSYTICVDATNFDAGAPLAGYVPTQPGEGTIGTGSVSSPASTALAEGGVDLTLDFGYALPVTIGDYTWLDLNHNGIQDAGEPALGGVTVVLYQTNLTSHACPAVATNTSDANGYYLFTNLAPGTYQIHFAPPAGGYGSTPAFQGGDPAKDSDYDTNTYLTPFITQAPGTTNLTVDAGFVPAPTAVTEVAMCANVAAGQIRVTWQTYSEENLLAFDLTRTVNGTVTDVTPDYVFASGQPVGANYSVLDAGATNAGSYTYDLYGFYSDLSVALLATAETQLTASVAPAPLLLSPSVRISGSGILLRWTGGQPSYVVEQSTSLGTGAVWQVVGSTTNTGMTVPLTGPANFFRIRGN